MGCVALCCSANSTLRTDVSFYSLYCCEGTTVDTVYWTDDKTGCPQTKQQNKHTRTHTHTHDVECGASPSCKNNLPHTCVVHPSIFSLSLTVPKDASDHFREGEGSLLPLWRFSTDRTKRKQVRPTSGGVCVCVCVTLFLNLGTLQTHAPSFSRRSLPVKDQPGPL